MSEFINTIDALGDEVVCASIVDRSITEFKDNVITTISDRAFFQNESITLVDLPSVKQLVARTFDGCRALSFASFSQLTTIGNHAFNTCAALTALILQSETMCTLTSSYAFLNTPIRYGTGYIYVPRSLLSDDDATKDYRRATNWSDYSTKFRALEDWTVDGTVSGELDWDKINVTA